jgi:diadenosine tetraphosphatase ApaH/serine/threonine PP2A family protein phosphatase
VRVLLLSDIHANLEALEACLADVPGYDLCVNLGDVVGYGASPNEVIERSRGLGKWFVRGNHDRAVSGLMELRDFNPIAAAAARWTGDALTPENLEWLRALPQGPVTIEGLPEVQFVHGSPLDEDDYVITPHDAAAPLRESPVLLTCLGHTHLQGVFCYEDGTSFEHPNYKTVGQSEQAEFSLQVGSRYMVNPGSVGQPRDGDWRAAFAVYDSDKRVVTFYRRPYDLKSAQEKILAANLPQRLATRLAEGR